MIYGTTGGNSNSSPSCWNDNSLSLQFLSCWCVGVVSDSCTSIMHFPPVWCGSSAALQVCPEFPGLFPICLVKWLLIHSGWEWTCNQQSCLIPLSTFHFPPQPGHISGTYTPTVLGGIWTSFPVRAKDFLGCLKMIRLPSHPEFFCNLHIYILTFRFCGGPLRHSVSESKRKYIHILHFS